MLRSFIFSDVYRVLLGSVSRENLLTAMKIYEVHHDGSARLMSRDDGSEVWIALVFLDGDTLEQLTLLTDLQVMQIDNISQRLRAVPALPGVAGTADSRRFASRGFGAAA